MKKSLILIICTLSILGVGCTKTSEVNTKKVDSSYQEDFQFTPHQEEVIAQLCDEKDDNDIVIQTTFDEFHCYHI